MQGLKVTVYTEDDEILLRNAPCISSRAGEFTGSAKSHLIFGRVFGLSIDRIHDLKIMLHPVRCVFEGKERHKTVYRSEVCDLKTRKRIIVYLSRTTYLNSNKSLYFYSVKVVS